MLQELFPHWLIFLFFYVLYNVWNLWKRGCSLAFCCMNVPNETLKKIRNYKILLIIIWDKDDAQGHESRTPWDRLLKFSIFPKHKLWILWDLWFLLLSGNAGSSGGKPSELLQRSTSLSLHNQPQQQVEILFFQLVCLCFFKSFSFTLVFNWLDFDNGQWNYTCGKWSGELSGMSFVK